jgi:glycosyltransferase involved in cell wall biosynthesis
MREVVYAGAHLGYDTGKVPVGGGAQVGIHLIRQWVKQPRFSLTVLGSGPIPPVDSQHVRYVHIPWHVPGQDGTLTDLSVRGYASFSRQFERGVTEFLREYARDRTPRRVCVIHNDICEAGDFAAIGRMGYRQVAIFHVDVVDYTASIYLRGVVSAPTLARAYRGFARLGGARLLPDVARLILEKQETCAKCCDLLVVPSREMAEVIRASYPWRTDEDVLVIPWGAIVEEPSAGVEEEVRRISAQYGLDGSAPVLIALSRISPEKGQDLLLRALRVWERRGGGKLVTFICGAPAFVHGQGYIRRLRRLASRLRRVEVHFPGYVTGVRKAALFRLADLYVFPSRHESYGLTLVEALSAGLPVLTTDHRSARDLVRPEFGRVVPPTPAGVYQGLGELLSRREALSEMGTRARAFAAGLRFELAAARLAEAIEDLL